MTGGRVYGCELRLPLAVCVCVRVRVCVCDVSVCVCVCVCVCVSVCLSVSSVCLFLSRILPSPYKHVAVLYSKAAKGRVVQNFDDCSASRGQT